MTPPKNSESCAPEGVTIERRVGEGDARDVGRGFVRLDPEDIRTLGVRIGDTVSVRGDRACVCRVMPTGAEKRGEGLARLDGVSRHNAGAGLDGRVIIAPLACPTAEEVRLTPMNVGAGGPAPSHLAGLLDGLAVTPGDRVRAALFGSGSAEFGVESVRPQGPARIVPETRVSIGKRPTTAGPAPSPAYEDIGGLETQLQRVREMIEAPLRHPEVFEALGIAPPRGVLLHGPPGCGKTLIARTIAHESGAAFFTISGPEVVHRHYGESEAHLRQIWADAAKRAPAIIFLDEIDAIAPKRERTEGEVEKRIVAQLLALMDGMKTSRGVVVLAATNLPDNIDPALRRPGRFDREIEIPIPDRRGRRAILDVHSRGMPLADDVNLDRLAGVTHGYVGADVEALCREAAMACLREATGGASGALAGMSYAEIAALRVSDAHFRSALSEILPSAIREVFVESPNVRWSDVGGLESTKSRLREAVEWPLIHAALFDDARVEPARGVLLCGPPGCGKTMLAKAVATEAEANFISVKGAELLSRYVGESEAGVRDIFAKARRAAPCVVFFDELDALAPSRGRGENAVGERVVAQLLTELDGLQALRSVLTLGATNRPDLIDPALLRPGRFDEVIDIGLPDEASRTAIFRVHMRGRPFAPGVAAEALAGLSDGASGADIAGVCREAAMTAVRRAVLDGAALEITMDDARRALNRALASSRRFRQGDAA